MSRQILDNIVIVLKNSSKYEFPQGYLVEPFNKKQLESARNWACTTEQDKFTKQVTQVDAIEIVTDNKGFKVTLLESANESYQGGKLSFWNCLIEKEPDIKCIIGIDQSSLLSLLKQSTLINGVLQERVSLYKSSTAGAMHPGMKEWKEAITRADDKPRAPKTTKWVLGQSYKTLTTEDMYICNIYKAYELDEKVVEDPMSSIPTLHIKHVETHLKFNTNTTELSALINAAGSYSPVSEHSDVKTIAELMDKYLDKVKNGNVGYRLSYLDAFSPLSYSGKLVSKFPSREIGSHKIEAGDTDATQAKLKELLNELKTRTIKDIYSINSIAVDALIKAFGYRAYPGDKLEFTDDEIQSILRKVSKSVFIDFGDGVEHQGWH